MNIRVIFILKYSVLSFNMLSFLSELIRIYFTLFRKICDNSPKNRDVPTRIKLIVL
jgi:hypothetical protein